MSYTFKPAVRDRVSLLLALAGASGSGKTLSALKIARGLADGDDNKIAFIDTEAGRGKHYAVAPGEKPGPERFAFQYCELRPPFTPEAYAEAIKAADEAGFAVIVVDSCSHVMEGEGGLHDQHDTLVEDAVAKSKAFALEKGWRFDETQARDRASVGAWREPKMRHKRFVSRLLQSRAHLLLCMRADEKLRMEKVKDDRGREKTVIIQAKDLPPAERWVPICEKRLPYEMTLSLVLSPAAPGIPIPIKLQEQHRGAVPLDRHLSEDTGRLLAAWARGESSAARTPHTPRSAATGEGADEGRRSLPGPSVDDVDSYSAYAEMQIEDATDKAALIGWWNSADQKEERRKRGVDKATLDKLMAKVRARAAEIDDAQRDEVPA